MTEKNHNPLSNFQDQDKPREKLLHFGPSALTDRELLAILFRTGIKGKNVLEMATEVLQSAENNLLNLAKKNVLELSKIKGMGITKAITLSAALELGNRKTASEILEKPQINNKDKLGKYLQYLYADKPVEVVGILLFNSKLQVVKEKVLATGNSSEAFIDKKTIFSEVLIHNASSFMIFHNHPSGSLEPSEKDILLTKDLNDISKMLHISFLDHIIVSQKGFKSILKYSISL